jgi:hypothetical protein
MAQQGGLGCFCFQIVIPSEVEESLDTPYLGGAGWRYLIFQSGSRE